MFRHGLRVSEAISLRRDEVDLDHARLWVRRLKSGLAVEHPIAGDGLLDAKVRKRTGRRLAKPGNPPFIELSSPLFWDPV